MSKILEAWEQVLREAVSSDFDDQQFAVFQIGLILERHNPGVDSSQDVYDEHLSRELQRLVLAENRQQDAVQYLFTLAKGDLKEAETFLYAITRAQPKVVIEPLIRFLSDCGGKLNANAAYQVMMILINLTQSKVAYPQELHQMAIFYANNWAEHKDDDLAAKARRWLALQAS